MMDTDEQTIQDNEQINSNDKQVNRFSDEISKEILKIKFQNNMTDKSIVDLISYLMPSIEKMDEFPSKDLVYRKILFNFSHQTNMRNYLKKIAKIEPIQKTVEQPGKPAIVWQYIPVEESIRKLLENSEVFETLFLQKSMYLIVEWI